MQHLIFTPDDFALISLCAIVEMLINFYYDSTVGALLGEKIVRIFRIFQGTFRYKLSQRAGKYLASRLQAAAEVACRQFS